MVRKTDDGGPTDPRVALKDDEAHPRDQVVAYMRWLKSDDGDLKRNFQIYVPIPHWDCGGSRSPLFEETCDGASNMF